MNNTDPLNTFPNQVHSSSGVLCTNRGHSGYFLLCGHRHFSFLVEAIVLFLSFVLATLFTGKFRVEETINCKNPFLTVILILRVSNTFSFSDFFFKEWISNASHLPCAPGRDGLLSLVSATAYTNTPIRIHYGAFLNLISKSVWRYL